MKIKGMRWWVIVLLFVAAVLNYIDRQTLSALAPTIQFDLEMNDQQYANVINIFLIAYTISYIISGRIADKIGTRISLFIFVLWWSVFNMFTAASQGLTSLSFYRFGLGLGEAGIWPAASKAVSEWFPAKERALAIGLYTMGATFGATIAPYVVIPLATYDYSTAFPEISNYLGNGVGWRLAFILTGFAGLLWLGPWLLIYRRPEKSKLITSTELELLQNDSIDEDGISLESVKAYSQRFTINDSIIVKEIIPKIQKIAKKNKLEIVDLHSATDGHADLFVDEIHPNAKGAALIAKEIADLINKNKKIIKKNTHQ